MANTYTQLHIQFVFAVKYRMCLIHPSWEDELYKYITGIVQNHKHKMLAVNGMPDHIHVFVGLHPTESISSLMQTVKGESSEWINTKGFVKGRFQWQEGYGAFSYTRRHVKMIIDYVLNQKEHHRRKSFLEEYREFLKEFEIDFDERYIFKEPE
jgi:REP element-mobilizing transposase RayT